MTLAQILARLAALRGIVDGWINSGGLYFDPAHVFDLFERYAALRDRLRVEHKDLFDDLPVRPMPTLGATSDFEGRGYIAVESLRLLLSDLDYCENVFANLPTTEGPSIKVSREGVFFAGQYFDALHRISEILGRAASSIVLIDGYLDDSVLKLLTAKSKTVSVSILTKAASVTPAFRVAATAFGKQYQRLAVRTSESFHDRFVIIDDTEFYHLGASIKDAGHRGFMFSRIEEPAIIEALRLAFATEWTNAAVVI